MTTFWKGLAVVGLILGMAGIAVGAETETDSARVAEKLKPVPVGTPQPVNRIEIRVGNEIVTSMEIEEPLRQLRERLNKEFRGEELEKRMRLARHQHLKRLIEQKLLLLEAREQKIEVSDSQVTEQARKEVDTLRSQFPDEKEFKDQLAMEHLTEEDLHQQRERMVKEQLLQQRLLQGKLQEFNTGAEIGEEQLADYYTKHKNEFRRQARVQLSQIFVARPDAGLPADAFAKADELAQAKIQRALSELNQKKEFAATARKYSEHRVTAEKGGKVGWIEQGELGMPEFDKVVFNRLKIGDTSKIIDTGRGYFIVNVEDRQEGGNIPLDEVRGRIRQILMSQGSEDRFDAWIESLKKKFKVVFSDPKLAEEVGRVEAKPHLK